MLTAAVNGPVVEEEQRVLPAHRHVHDAALYGHPLGYHDLLDIVAEAELPGPVAAHGPRPALSVQQDGACADGGGIKSCFDVGKNKIRLARKVYLLGTKFVPSRYKFFVP